MVLNNVLNQIINTKNYNNILQNIAKYSTAKQNVTFIAVTKKQTTQAIEALIKLGHINFGENKVDEALEKFTPLKQKYPYIVLHLIGPLQTNKVKKALGLFDVFHIIDRPSLIDEIAKHQHNFAQKQYLIQVNIGEEPQKSGCNLNELGSNKPHTNILVMQGSAETQMGFEICSQNNAEYEKFNIINYCNSKNIYPSGLMCILPINHQNTAAYFGLTKMCAMQNNLPFVSMGMSADYTTALQLGSTHIRIGSLLFAP